MTAGTACGLRFTPRFHNFLGTGNGKFSLRMSTMMKLETSDARHYGVESAERVVTSVNYLRNLLEIIFYN